MAIVFQDSFTVSVDTNLEAYPSGAPDYERALGSQTFIVKADVDNVNTIVGADGDTVYRVINPAVPTVDQQITITVTREAGDYKTAGPCVRCTTDNCYALVPSTEASVELYRVTNGAFTLLTTFAIANVAGVHTYSLKAEGNGATVTLSAWVDGGAVYTYADTAADRKLSGTPGIWRYYNWQGIYFDDVIVEDVGTGGGVADPATSTIGASPVSIPADGVSTSAITVQLKDASGTNLTTGGDAVTLATDAGYLGGVTDNTDGTYSSSLTAGIAVDIATITGTVNGSAITDTAQVSFTQPAGVIYTSTFDGTENPLSEAGDWVHTNTSWPAMQKISGIARGTGYAPVNYDDNYSILANLNAAPDQKISATISLGDTSLWDSTKSHEFLLFLRANEGTETMQCYEVIFGWTGNAADQITCQIVRWNGAKGDFTVITAGTGTLPIPADGDVVSAEIIGSTITAYYNGIQLRTTTDATYTSGQPGIGIFDRDDANPTLLDFGYYDVSVTGTIATAPTTYTKSALLDSILERQGVLRTASIEAALQREKIERISSIDSSLQSSAIIMASLDAQIQNVINIASAIDAILRSGNSAEASLDSILQIQKNLSVSADSILTSSGNYVSSTIDAALLKQSILSVLSLDAELKKQGLLTASSIDSVLQVKSLSIAANTDAALRKLRAIISAIDAIMVTGGTSIISSLDAMLSATKSLVSNIDSALGKERSASASINGILALTGLLTSAMDAVLTGATTISVALNSLIKKADIPIAVAMDAILSGGLTMGCPTATVLLYVSADGSIIFYPSA